MHKPVFEIDGRSFDSLDGFFDAFGSAVLSNTEYERNLDAFNDVLRGGFGSPDGGFVLRWKNSDVSRDTLGWNETVRFVERKLSTCHPSNIDHVRDDLASGDESEDGVELELA